MTVKISMIAAIGMNREIGYRNDLLWHIPADLKRFKNITSGHTVIMGRKTFESIGCKPLRNRKNIVITTQKQFHAQGVEIVHSVDEALEHIKHIDEVFILGGAAIYKQFIPYADTLYLTLVKKEYKADTFFPEYNLGDWEISEFQKIINDEDAGVDYSFITLTRKKRDI